MGTELNNLSEQNAKIFIQILENADRGCSFCVSDLLELFVKEFPEHKKLAEVKLKYHLSKTNSKDKI